MQYGDLPAHKRRGPDTISPGAYQIALITLMAEGCKYDLK